MSVDTKIQIVKTGSIISMIQDIQKALKTKMNIFGDITFECIHERIKNGEFKDYDGYRIFFALDNDCDQFESGKEQRVMWLNYDYSDATKLINLSISAWGSNEEIARCLVDSFGGIVDLNDCDSIYIDYCAVQPR